MRIIFDDDEFDRVIRNSLSDGDPSHQAFIIKENATVNGRPGICISFISYVGRTPHRVQTVMPLREFLIAVSSIAGKYEYLLEAEWPKKDDPTIKRGGHIDGVAWDAVQLERCWIVSAENGKTGVATTEPEIEHIAKMLISGTQLDS